MVDEQRVVAMDAQMTKHNTDGELKTIERRVYLYLPIPLLFSFLFFVSICVYPLTHGKSVSKVRKMGNNMISHTMLS
jgi:hypothetical protein